MFDMRWVVAVGLAVLPIPTIICGLALLNLVSLAAVLGLWLYRPDLGPWLYTPFWVNLVGMRAVNLYTPLLFPGYPFDVRAMAAEQNRSSAILILVGIVGAIRSALVPDALGIVSGLVSAVVLFFAQSLIFTAAAASRMLRSASP
jgi:hypothetical protein